MSYAKAPYPGLKRAVGERSLHIGRSSLFEPVGEQGIRGIERDKRAPTGLTRPVCVAEHLVFELTLRIKALVDSASCGPSDLVGRTTNHRQSPPLSNRATD